MPKGAQLRQSISCTLATPPPLATHSSRFVAMECTSAVRNKVAPTPDAYFSETNAMALNIAHLKIGASALPRFAVAAEAMGGEKRTSTTLITTAMIECVLTPMTM